MKFLAVPTLVTLFGTTVAHFSLDYPPTRGLEHDTMNQTVCGGFNTTGNRTTFPLTGGRIQVSPGHAAVMWAQISFANNPRNISQFNTTSSGGNYTNLVDKVVVSNETVCWNADVSGLNVTAARNGANATIVILYQTATSVLYQCADVVLSSSATLPENATWSNLTCSTVEPGSYVPGSENHGHGDSHGSSTATSPGSSPTGGASPLQVGSTLAVAGLVAVFNALL